MKLFRFLFLALLAGGPAVAASAQTGKVAGLVTDAATGETLPGVNVVIDGTTTGATTDVDGYYAIINVSPGTYTLRASFVGYTAQVMADVRVNIDLTTEVNFTLQEETLGMDEVVVVAQTPVVQRDVSANVSNLNAAEIENLPVVSVDEVIGLQAGIDEDLSIRGSAQDEVAFLVDGMSMRDGRQNNPFTGISYTSIEEVQVQTGGFNAEYGNLRSGLVSVVTKEGPRDRYTADVLVRYAPPQRDYFGNLPSDRDGYWMRSFVDPDVAFVGTHEDGSPWDDYTRRQYPEFKGWNNVVQDWATDNDPTNDLSVEQAQALFDYYYRKDVDVKAPDYEVDASVGGPVPLIGRALGDLRFMGSYRQTQSAYFIPQQRDAYGDRMGRLRVTGNVTPRLKLNVQGMVAGQQGLSQRGQGFPDDFWTGEVPRYPWRRRDMSNALGNPEDIFADHRNNPTDISRTLFGADLSHTLSPRTFYEARVQRMTSKYRTHKPRERDLETSVGQIGPMPLDEAPQGWYEANVFFVTGMSLGGHWGEARDTSDVSIWTGRFDVTSQVNRYAQVKAGVEYNYSDYDISHAWVDSFFTSNTNPRYKWQRQPHQGGAYAQTKLELAGMIANLGVRADYWWPGGTWYEYDPYDRAFSPTYGRDSLDTVLEKATTERQVALSPRLGISFPVTERSKFYFNYGHFRQMLDPHDLFTIRKIVTSAVDFIGDPNHPMPRTVAYEMGYEQSLFDRFLVRASGYYKAMDRQSRQVRYTSLDGMVDYNRFEPLNYEDIRGFEVTLRKNAGRYVRGFVNFTYMAVKRGNFGFARQYESRAEQRKYERDSRAHYQERPVAEPYARFNLEFMAPRTFGPQVFGTRPLGDWRLSALGEWRAGEVFTWTGQADIIGLQNNVRWKDYYNLDLRLAKNFDTRLGGAQFFMDVTNVLNLRHLRHYGAFQGEYDYDYYMESLHLPADAFGDGTPPYTYIPGDDRPGTYRKPGVAFVPIEIVETTTDVKTPHGRPLYYEVDTARYMQWVDGAWREADRKHVDQVLEDKAYIDMPNVEFMRFFNPRQVRFGLRLSL